MTNIDNFSKKKCGKNIEKQILTDLRGSQKRISSTFFYDEKGSKLFEEITKLPEYYLTRTEMPLIKQAAEYLKDRLRNVDIIEFGSGDCKKISILFDGIPEYYRESICYIPFDISSSAIQKSSQILHKKFPGIRIHGIVADFMTQLNRIPLTSKKIICFLGSTIGNFSRDHAKKFVSNISTIMQPGDLVLLGFDMVKKKTIIEQAYNDSENLTEQFNKNILSVVNTLVDTDFNPDDFNHVAFYNEQLSRIEMHLKATKNVTIFSSKASTAIHIKKDETIHTENSHKFTTDHIRQLARNANLEIEHMFTDEDNWFSLVVLRKS